MAFSPATKAGLCTAGLQQAHVIRACTQASCTHFLYIRMMAPLKACCAGHHSHQDAMLFVGSASGMRQHALQEAAEVAPTDEEVATAKSETLNSFVFNFASTNAQMQRVAAYALLGIPEVTPDLIFLLASWLLLSKTTCASGFGGHLCLLQTAHTK